MYVRVAVDTDAASYLDSYTYEVPEELRELAKLGACVLVPFGTAQVIGYIVGTEEKTDLEKTRKILAVIDSPIVLSGELVELAGWMSRRYVCGLSRCAHSTLPGVVQCRVKTIIDATGEPPPGNSTIMAAIMSAGGSLPIESLRKYSDNLAADLRKLEKSGCITRRYRLIAPEGKAKEAAAVELAIPLSQVEEESSKLAKSRARKQAEVLRFVAETGAVTCAQVTAQTGAAESVITSLVSKGLLKRVRITVRRSVAHTPTPSTAHLTLTPDQQNALDATVSRIGADTPGVLLMHGVTASGKTEVYLRAIEHAISKGLRSLVLLPEISLTAQVLNIFRGRFGDRVAVLHSMLSPGERFDEWMRAQDGEVDVLLGARSAVFAPLESMGMVIVDEEHEPSYKQDNDPRYHGRDVAIQRAKANGALAVLGSATPSVESYFLAKSGKYGLVAMRERIAQRPMPDVTIADLREEYQKGRPTIFSQKLLESMRARLALGQQVILFQNRRAYATFLLCRECGYTAGCPNCAVSLKLHAAERIMRCHHCDYEQQAPTLCPQCGGRKIGMFGIGTERIEEETRAAFPDARILRMDRDTTTRKGSHGAILDAFRKREADVLVGTQMIAKGLDFPGVTLVGVISADTSLNLPDFRAGERTFQLLSQVAGRAGRGEDCGEVVIQTFNPEHYAVVAAAAHDYEGFYEQEIRTRKEVGYPPFSAVVNVVAADKVEVDARKRLNDLIAKVTEKAPKSGAPVDVLGPVPAPVAKLRNEYRWHAIIRSKDRGTLMRTLRDALDELPSVRRKVVIDVDPASLI